MIGINFFKKNFLFLLSSYFVPISRIIVSFFTTLLLSPIELGYIQSLLLLSTYLDFTHLGVYNSLNRNIAYYEGQGDFKKVDRMIGTGHYIVRLTSFISLFLFICFALVLYYKEKEPILLVASLSVMLQVYFYHYNILYDTVLRSKKLFNDLANINIIENVLNLLLISLLYVGLRGKVLADALSVLCSYIMRKKKFPSLPQPIFCKNEWFFLVRTGFPIFISAYLYGLLLVYDQTLILSKLGTEKLGLYQIPRLLNLSAALIPAAIATIQYPTLLSKYAVSHDSIPLRQFLWKSLFFNILLLMGLTFITYLLIDTLIVNIFPKHVPALPAIKTTILGFGSLIVVGPAILFNVLKKNTSQIYLLLFCLILYYILGTRELEFTLERAALLRNYILYFFAGATILQIIYFLYFTDETA